MRFFYYESIYSYYGSQHGVARDSLVPDGGQPVACFPMPLVWFSTRVDFDPVGCVYAAPKPGQTESRLLTPEETIQLGPVLRIEVPEEGLVQFEDLEKRSDVGRDQLIVDLAYWRSHGAHPRRDWWASAKTILAADWITVEARRADSDWMPLYPEGSDRAAIDEYLGTVVREKMERETARGGTSSPDWN